MLLTPFSFILQIASALDNVAVGPVFDRIEDAVVQADEVDGKILQFEGGLAVTSNIISGAYKLAGHGKVKFSTGRKNGRSLKVCPNAYVL